MKKWQIIFYDEDNIDYLEGKRRGKSAYLEELVKKDRLNQLEISKEQIVKLIDQRIQEIGGQLPAKEQKQINEQLTKSIFANVDAFDE